MVALDRAIFLNRLTTLLIPHLDSIGYPPQMPQGHCCEAGVGQSAAFLWTDKHEEEKMGLAKHTHFLLPNSQIIGPLPPIRSGSRYSVSRKTRKISPHGAKRCGTECSLLLMLSQPQSSHPPNVVSYSPICLAATRTPGLLATPPQLNSHLHAPPYTDMDLISGCVI